MSIQFKTIVELRAMLDSKQNSAAELMQESLGLAKKHEELNCFVTMNEERALKKASAINLDEKTTSNLFGHSPSAKRFVLYRGFKNNMLFKNIK